MTGMRSVWLTLIVLAACGGAKAPDKFDESLAAMEALAASQPPPFVAILGRGGLQVVLPAPPATP